MEESWVYGKVQFLPLDGLPMYGLISKSNDDIRCSFYLFILMKLHLHKDNFIYFCVVDSQSCVFSMNLTYKCQTQQTLL